MPRTPQAKVLKKTVKSPKCNDLGMSTRCIFGCKRRKILFKQPIFFTEIEQTINFELFVREPHASNDVGAAAKEPTELFIKNTGLC